VLRAIRDRPRTFNFVDAKEHLPNGSCREDAKTAQERAISQRRVGEGRHVNVTLPYGACLKAGRRLSERRCTRVDASEQSDEHKSHSDQDRRSRAERTNVCTVLKTYREYAVVSSITTVSLNTNS
jgi:hypothetical protein